MKDSEDLKKLVIFRDKIEKFLIEFRELFLGKEVLDAWERIAGIDTMREYGRSLKYQDPIQLCYVSDYLEIKRPVDITGYHYLNADNRNNITQIFNDIDFSIDEIYSMKNYIDLGKYPKIFPELCSKDSFNKLNESNPKFFSKLMYLCKERIELLNSFWEKIESISAFLLNKKVTLMFLKINLPELYRYYDKV